MPEDAPDCRRLVVVDPDPLAWPELDALFARVPEARRALEVRPDVCTKRWLDRAREAGVTELVLLVGGVRARVHEAIAGGSWRAALQGIAHATASGFEVEVVMPVWRDNLGDLVPLAEWLLALPAPIRRFSPWVPPEGVPGPHAPRGDIAEASARAFETVRRKKIAFGFADPLGVPPCAAGGALDHAGWLFLERVRRQQRASGAFVRVAACEACSLGSTCPGVEPSYADEATTPIPLDTSMGWRLRPRDFDDDDYRYVSAFDNEGGPGRGLLRINGHCQMACAFCFVDRRVPDFPGDELRQRIDALAARQTDHLVLSGGEPTLHPDLPGLIAHARTRGFEVIEIQTNGVKCEDAAYVASLVEAGLTKATVSLHSVDPETSDAITKMKGAFPRTVQGLRNLRDAGVQAQIAHVITKRNYEALPAFVRTIGEWFAPEPGAPWNLSLCLALAQGISDLVYSWVIPSFTEVRPHVKEALDHCLAIGLGFGGLVGQGGYPPCMLDGDLRYYEDNLSYVYRSPDHAAQFHKSEACRRCSFDALCVGLRQDYVRSYGDAEIQPFTAELPAADKRRLPLAP